MLAGGPKVDMSEVHDFLLGDANNDCGDGYSCDGLTMCGGERGSCPCDAKNNTCKQHL